MAHLGVRRKELKTFLDRVNERFPLLSAYLFGSRARGDELEGSDYDLVLVSEAFGGVCWSERVRAVQDFWNLDVPLEAFCYTPAEFERKKAEISSVAEGLKEAVRLR